MNKTLFFLLVFSCALSHAQQQAYIWHFGQGDGIDFSSGSPVLISSSQNTFEGCASYCDKYGNLQFYTNGGGKEPLVLPGQDPGTIWNRNNAVMYDMAGVEGGGFSAQQSSVIFEAPGGDSTYYLFTMDEIEWDLGASPGIIAAQPGGRGLSYFKVDMRLNGGLGAVSLPNQQLFTPSYEGICAVRHANGRDYWVIINQDSLGLGIYRVDPAGVTFAGLYSSLSSTTGNYQYPSIIKGSPDGQHLMATFKGQTGSYQDHYLLDFNNATGQVTGAQLIDSAPSSVIKFATSYEFSPNSRYLYFTFSDSLTSFPLNQKVVRYDSQAPNIQASRTVVGSALISALYFGLQLAPDGNIYFVQSANGPTLLHRIVCPNSAAPTLEFNVLPVVSTSLQSLPNFPAWLFESDDLTFVSLGPDTVRLCDVGGSFQLNALNTGSTFLWSTGATTQSITVTTPGTYSVTVNGPCGPGNDQIVIVDCAVAPPSLPCDSILSQNNITVCGGEPIQLQASLGAFSNVTGIKWTGGNGTYIPSDTVAAPLYIPTAAEIAQGSLNLVVEVNAVVIDTTNPGRLIAYDHASQDLIFEISPLNGSIDSIQDNLGNDWVGAGYESATSVLYGVSAFSSFSSINLNNAVTNPVGNFAGERFYSGEYDNVNGKFYSVGNIPTPTGVPANQFLCTINTSTAALNVIGNLNLFTVDNFYTGSDDGINGLAFDPSLNVLYGVTANGKLYRINVTNATPTFVGNTQPDLRGLAYDAVSGKLWGISSSATLYQINKNSGAVITTVNCQVPFFFVTSLTYVSGAVEQSIVCRDTLTITFNPIPIAALVSPDDACAGSAFGFSLSTNGTINSLNWNFGDPNGGSSNTSTQLNPTHVYNTPGTYSVSVVANLECLIDTFTSSVTVLPVPIVNASASVLTIQPGESVELSASGADVFLWSPTDGLSCSVCSTTTASPLTTTTFFVSGAFSAGCSASDSVTISVELICKELFVPDIFSPNGLGDPENEKFCIYSNCIKSMSLGVYNRWGELIFSSQSRDQCWDGTHKGVPAMAGVYTYRLFVEQVDGKFVEKSGNFTLTR